MPQLIVPVADAGALERAAARDAGELAGSSPPGDGVVVYLAVVGEDGHGRARAFFAEGPQVVEDPATGSAVGPLCAYLARYAGIDAIAIEQGEQAGRPVTAGRARRGRPRPRRRSGSRPDDGRGHALTCA